MAKKLKTTNEIHKFKKFDEVFNYILVCNLVQLRQNLPKYREKQYLNMFF